MPSKYMVPVMPVYGSTKPVNVITLILSMVHVRIEFHPVSSGSVCFLLQAEGICTQTYILDIHLTLVMLESQI